MPSQPASHAERVAGSPSPLPAAIAPLRGHRLRSQPSSLGA